MLPFITSKGFLLPCCDAPHEFYETPSEINREEFNLNTHSFIEVISSDEWNNTLQGLRHTTLKHCVAHCSTKQLPRQSPNVAFNKNAEYDTTYVPTINIPAVQLETTSRCTLSCPYCSRTRVDKNILNKHDLSLDIIEQVLNVPHIKKILDCGTFGDGIYYKYYHEMLDLILSYGTLNYYTMSVAATGRTQSWWDETHLLWEMMVRRGTQIVIFWGIDGLEDTSSMHRINQNWDEITENMKRSATYGVHSNWQFIPMSFNEHQIDEAMKLCKEWKIEFCLKPSDRFRGNDPNRPSNYNYYYDLDVENNITKNTPLLGNLNKK